MKNVGRLMMRPGSKNSCCSCWHWLGGILFTFVIAFFGLELSKFAVFNRIGQLACAILIAVVYRQVAGYPASIQSGIQFSAKNLLRYAIVLFGLKLNISVIFHQGTWLLVRDTGTIAFSIYIMVYIAKWLGADKTLSLLLGIGTGVCGAAAIAAVSPIVNAKEDDTAISVGIIALLGTIFAIGYTMIRPFLSLSPTQYGIWSGISLHEIAHVALAAAPAGQYALGVALLAKLGRVFLLIPLSVLLLAWMKRKNKTERAFDVHITFPWFLVGFILMSLIGSFVIGKYIILTSTVMNDFSNVTTFILTMAMVGLGLNVRLRDLRERALRPLIAMTITSVLLSVGTYFTL